MVADSRGMTNGGGAGGGGARGRDGEPMSQGDAEDPGGQGGAKIQRSAAEPERLRTKVELAGGRTPKELVGRSDKVQPEERSPEAMAGRCPTKAEPKGRGSPVELVDRWVTVEARELGAEVEPLGLRAELELEVRDTRTTVTLEDGSPMELAPYGWWAEGEQRGCQTTAVEEAGAGGWVGIHGPLGSQGCPLGSEPTPGWTRGLSLSLCWTGKREPTQGWMGPAGTKERGEGASQLPALFPSL